jgi:hypothetical protein
MRAGWAGFAVVVLTVAFATAGCGGGGDKESSSASACRGDATTEATNFPPGFPVPGELTFTSVHKDGPTNVADGYWAAGLDEAYNEYKDAVENADGYDILFTEKEDHDAEISYKGEGHSGQIALRDDCSESDTTRVHVTNRPE